ncbi:DNA polymerase lambda-like isoform X2 [Ostrea edulis]|uniref:DNA polymerase lambda-like isoform X2 n=1 Tax=Ostrea edulis TaxID=37623 RepID=UPI0024AEA8FC|nr:DNA polymerase lambda-like isoform X2 [Ostrea edulis]
MSRKSRKVPETICHKVDDSQKFFKNVKIFLLNAGIEKARCDIFRKQTERYGGVLVSNMEDLPGYIVVEDKMEAERMCRLLRIDQPPSDVNIVKSSWLSACIKQKQCVDIATHELDLSLFTRKRKKELDINDSGNEEEKDNTSEKNQEQKPARMWHSYKKPKVEEEEGVDPESDYAPSDGEDTVQGPSTSSTSSTSPEKLIAKGQWICTQSSKNVSGNLNEHITSKLEAMVKKYESTSDQWRAFGYKKAIQALRKYPKPITSWEEAKALPGVGARLADKIWEIAESGELRKLNEFNADEDIKGFKTLDDLRTKAKLTHQQKIGLNHYDDILDRMPRSEAAAIEQVVRMAAESLVTGVIVQCCGSYRRGKATCGDVDILVTHPDGKSHRGLFSKLLSRLKETGFLTDDLVSAEDNGSQKKYLGICRLPGENHRYRRIDIIVVPYDEYACALVYFTGSAHLNRSLRLLAKKSGMSLSEHSLNTGVIRKGNEKIFEGTPLPTPTEESVFKHLGVPYRPPEERDH